MKEVTLIRTETGDEGTFGEITVGEQAWVSLELPWRGNKPAISCVPAGDYLFRWRSDSPKNGECFELWDDPKTPKREDAAGRAVIQIHAANLAGDKSKGYACQLEGCTAPGKGLAVFGVKPPAAADVRTQRGVVQSRQALVELVAALGCATFMLKISWAPGISPEIPAVNEGTPGGY